MDFERAIQTQRNALLRLLAGWLAVVVLLSAAPISPLWTRQMRVFLSSVLQRAELAAHYLVIVQARLLARRIGGIDPARLHLFDDPLRFSNADEPPSLVELRARILALRCLLKNLPRRGERLLRRTMVRRSPRVSSPGGRAVFALRRLVQILSDDQCASPSLWHPPRAGARLRPLPYTPSARGAEALACGLR